MKMFNIAMAGNTGVVRGRSLRHLQELHGIRINIESFIMLKTSIGGRMSAEIKKEIERLSRELEALRQIERRRKPVPEIRLKRYRMLLNRISKSPEVDFTPDELLGKLRRKEY